MKKCLLLDSSYMPRNIIRSDRAYVIKMKGNADIIHEHEEIFGLVDKTLKIRKPSIIKVFSYINIKHQNVPFTRNNVFKRDNYECVYCGCSIKRILTIDHVIPRSKGGKDTWENWVTACMNCNLEKADLTLEEYGKSIPQPKRPHYLMLLKNVDYIYDEWKQYLFID